VTDLLIFGYGYQGRKMADFPSNVLKFAKVISVAEGFGQPDAIPTKANNPGDLTAGDAGGFQTTGVMNKEGVVRFANLSDGWLALYVKVNRILEGHSSAYPLSLTLEQMGLKYSGGDPNWSKNVANYLGINEGITLAELAQQL
jgi:hypothetical protein